VKRFIGLISFVIALVFGSFLLVFAPNQASAEQEVHHLAFASDFHSTEGSIQNAFSGMPDDVEYVSLIGDMVGGFGDMTPKYESSWILGMVQDVFPNLDSTNVSIIWASHDANVQDEGAGIVKCPGGYGSSVIYQGLNSDGSTAYYIYAVGFNELRAGGSVSSDAAAAFKSWVDGIEKCAPVIVLCHVPLEAKRGDNFGALYWNEALNYAATGVEGITTKGTDAPIIRNVIYLYGHNHTVAQDEYYYAPRSSMLVQIDASISGQADTSENDELDVQADEDEGPYAPSTLLAQGETIIAMDVEDEEYDAGYEDDDLILGAPPRPPFPHKAEGVTSDIYYTALVAGYLKTSGNATLITFADDVITLEKYNGGEEVDLGVDENNQGLAVRKAVIQQFSEEESAVHDGVSITKVDQDGAALSGASFALSQGDKALATYEGESFEIRTDDEALVGLLPSAGESVSLTLKEVTAPEGYEPSSEAHEVTITATAEETLVDRVYVTAITYSMSVDGEKALTVTNTKTKPEDDSDKQEGPSEPGKDDPGKKPGRKVSSAEPLPKTGDTKSGAALFVGLGALLLSSGCLIKNRS